MAAILIAAEQAGGRNKNVNLKSIQFAQALAARSGAEVHALMLGPGAAQAATAIQAFGLTKIHVCENAAFQHHLAQPFGAAIAALAKSLGVSHVVFANTSSGKDVAPRVAARLNAGMAADVSGLDGDNFLRPIYAGNAIATVAVTTPVKVVTVLASAMPAPAAKGGATPIATYDAPVEAGRARFLEFHEAKSERPELTDAAIVVSGGRGLKEAENYKKYIEPLADVLGAAVGASRAIVDAGWVPNDWQVGQTGKNVAPNLYIAVGISGAIQHLAGMKNSKVIVAINKDAEAPIFTVADFGLVQDLFKAVPELTEELRKLKAADK